MRPTPRRVLKTVCVVTVMGFLVMNLNLLVQTANDDAQRRASDLQGLSDVQQQAPGGNGNNSKGGRVGNATTQLRGNASLPGAASGTTVGYVKPAPGPSSVYARHAGLIKQIEAGPKNSPPEINATEIREFIVRSNAEQTVHNLDKFDLRAGSETLVLVVQVHNRADYLKHLVDSLRRAKNIEHSLLIFSHDIYDEEVNTIVKAIDFCPVSNYFKIIIKSSFYMADMLVCSDFYTDNRPSSLTTPMAVFNKVLLEPGQQMDIHHQLSSVKTCLVGRT